MKGDGCFPKARQRTPKFSAVPAQSPLPSPSAPSSAQPPTRTPAGPAQAQAPDRSPGLDRVEQKLCKICAKFAQKLCKICAIFLQFFCNFFASFFAKLLQKIKVFAKFLRKPLFFAKILQNTCKKLAKVLQKFCSRHLVG